MSAHGHSEGHSETASTHGKGGKSWVEGLVGGMAEGAWKNGWGFVEALHKRKGGSSGGEKHGHH